MKKLSVTLTHRQTLWGWIYLLVQLIVLPEVLQGLNSLLPTPLSAANLNFVFFCLNFLCVAVIFRKLLIGCGKIALANPWRCLRSAFVGLMLYWLLCYVYGILYAYLYPDFSNVNDASINTLVKENPLLITIGTVFLVPIAEETLYRGLLFGGLYNRNKIAAFAVSTLVFAALHVVGYIGYYPAGLLFMCFLQYIPAGLSLGWAYADADSIWAPIVMHITINQIGILSMR